MALQVHQPCNQLKKHQPNGWRFFIKKAKILKKLRFYDKNLQKISKTIDFTISL